MDTVGTFEMAVELAKLDLFTTVHKHYSIDEWRQFADANSANDKVFWRTSFFFISFFVYSPVLTRLNHCTL
jgi:hypothetical protein